MTTIDDDRVYCGDCGERIRREAEICPACGCRQLSPPPSSVALDDLLEGRNPFVAALLSAFVPGLGHVYVRSVGTGFAFFVAFLLALGSLVVLVGVLLVPTVWLVAASHAYRTAKARAEQHRRPVPPPHA